MSSKSLARNVIRLVTLTAASAVLFAGTLASDAEAAFEMVPGSCRNVQPYDYSATRSIECSFRDTFSKNGYWMHRAGTYLQEYLPYSGGWYVTYGQADVWIYLGGRWEWAGCQYYDQASGEWLNIIC